MIVREVLLIQIKRIRDYLRRKLGYSRKIAARMRYQEINIIIEILKNKRPEHCLEWGAGYSSLFFPGYLSSGASWVSVEHDPGWYSKIKGLVKRPNTKIVNVPANVPRLVSGNDDDSYSDFRDYIDYPQQLTKKYDFILIDGKARKHCLTAALKILDKNGIIVLHNADREYYHEAFIHWPRQFLFNITGQNYGLWIASLNLDLSSVINIQKHLKIWKLLYTLDKAKKSIFPR